MKELRGKYLFLPISLDDITYIIFGRPRIDVTPPDFSFSIAPGEEPIQLWSNGEAIYYGMLDYESINCDSSLGIISRNNDDSNRELVVDILNGDVGTHTTEFEFSANMLNQSIVGDQGKAIIEVDYDIYYYK